MYKIKDLKTQIKVTSFFNYTVVKRIFSFTKMKIAIREKVQGFVYQNPNKKICRWIIFYKNKKIMIKGRCFTLKKILWYRYNA